MKKNKTNLDIAVTGMAGRFPGAGNIEQFWENLNSCQCLKFLPGEFEVLDLHSFYRYFRIKE